MRARAFLSTPFKVHQIEFNSHHTNTHTPFDFPSANDIQDRRDEMNTCWGKRWLRRNLNMPIYFQRRRRRTRFCLLLWGAFLIIRPECLFLSIAKVSFKTPNYSNQQPTHYSDNLLSQSSSECLFYHHTTTQNNNLFS